MYNNEFMKYMYDELSIDYKCHINIQRVENEVQPEFEIGSYLSTCERRYIYCVITIFIYINHPQVII